MCVIWNVARLNFSLLQAKLITQIKYLSRFRFNSISISCSAEYTYAENAQKHTLDKFTTCSTNCWPLCLPSPSLHCECHCASFYLRIFEMHPFGFRKKAGRKAVRKEMQQNVRIFCFYKNKLGKSTAVHKVTVFKCVF